MSIFFLELIETLRLKRSNSDVVIVLAAARDVVRGTGQRDRTEGQDRGTVEVWASSYLVDSREDGHEATQHRGADTGDVDERTLKVTGHT